MILNEGNVTIMVSNMKKAEGPVRLAFFADPDGTPLYLCQVLPHKHPH